MFHPHRPKARAIRSGMSLAELMISMVILTMVAGIIATMAFAVQTAATYTRGQNTAAQHARVVLDRIDGHLRGANVSPEFPGFIVVSWTESGAAFPDTLVIWNPNLYRREGDPIRLPKNPDGLPLTNEIAIVRPDPSKPHR